MTLYQQILTKYWGYSNFRPLQEEIIMSVAEGKDTLGLMPTGGGKSITFQVYALSKEGICIVVTPLIALMKDQVENLKKRKIKAVAIFSGMNKHEIDIALDNCIYGGYKFLYVSPERLATDMFRVRFEKMNVNLLAIDESHCISQWGYDFRPSYLNIADLREIKPNIPVLALTATATPEVVDDIQDKLAFKEQNVLQKSFERKNLTYIVRDVEDKQNYLLKIMKKIKGTGIVYARSRKKTVEIANFLRANKISADHYHAGLSNEQREWKQNQWKTERCRIIVSTNAFGMGIDKSNVRIVVHIDLPDNIEAYFQEAGRAGRDEKRAYAVLLYNNTDKVKIEKRIVTSFPEISQIKKTYNALGNYFQLPVGSGKNMSYDFRLRDFCKKFSFEQLSTYNSLKILQREGYIELTDEVHIASRIMFIVERDYLYKFQVANANFDKFTKLLLRSYAGLFADYIPIDEKMLAKRTNTSVEVIFNFLQNLSKQGIISYIPQRDKPVIVYREERLDDKALHIAKEDYDKRKKKYIDRVEAMINYASSENKCRSQILLSYFGDKNPYRCGECDVCKRRNSLDLSKYEFDIILDDLKENIKNNEYTLDKLLENITYNEEKVVKVIKWLLDNEKIKYNTKKILIWN